MPSFPPWQRYPARQCYDDIAASCYPLHPATATALLMLSDQIAQVNRTTFYYLQNRDEGGLAQVLDQRHLPSTVEIGGDELVRVHDTFRFFEGAIKAHARPLYDQYEGALSRLPDASDFEVAILRTVLILSVIASPDMAPTTSFLSFCLCDVLRGEASAQPLHAALEHLSAAGALWKNEATEVWTFVAGTGLMTEIDRVLEEELQLVQSDYDPARLLRYHPEIQEDIADRLGDFDLDPNDAGVVRRVGVRILDIAHPERAIEPVNPAREGSQEAWRSAMIYLVAVDTPLQLDIWRREAARLETPNVYFVIPREEVRLDQSQLRKFIAVNSALEKNPAGHIHEVLDSHYTRLRMELRQQFEQAFGNSGLRAGTVVVRAGRPDQPLAVASWNELLPTVAQDLETQFPHQLRVRCGTYNEWKTGTFGSAIANVVKRILKFDESGEYQAEYLGFTNTSQEAAVVDGVLVENQLLHQDSLNEKWELTNVDKNVALEALRVALSHFQTSGDRDFSKLFAKLVDPPYGIPNGIIPVLCALVFRTEGPRIAIYKGNQGQRVSDARVADALADMAKHPGNYQTRYTKLAGKQRIVFKAIGPLMGVDFSERLGSGEAFYGFCEQVRAKLKSWIESLPEAALKISELTETQRKLLRSLRGPVPPQLPVLADSLVEFAQDDPSTHAELAGTGTGTAFPAIAAAWQDLRGKIERHVEGVKAPVRTAVRTLLDGEQSDEPPTTRKLADVMRSMGELLGGQEGSFQQIADKLATENHPDPAVGLSAALAGKPPELLTDEDFGRARGVVDVTATLRRQQEQQQAAGQYVVLLPSGGRRTLCPPPDSVPADTIAADVARWRELPLTVEQLAFVALRTLLGTETDDSDDQAAQGVSAGVVTPDTPAAASLQE
jgi:hypothetical protein